MFMAMLLCLLPDIQELSNIENSSIYPFIPARFVIGIVDNPTHSGNMLINILFSLVSEQETKFTVITNKEIESSSLHYIIVDDLIFLSIQ
ncbi:8729_t:CDS:2 [Funneliformis mosseae]|uniref:8729_t:CDS:1 n=1 Tax=Funneliformis mosseae TaxID=27381 RepID=A0A9N8WLD0_FUNMO|nr:8729_t:CDS:2 [Funneliformis mosseae]